MRFGFLLFPLLLSFTLFTDVTSFSVSFSPFVSLNHGKRIHSVAPASLLLHENPDLRTKNNCLAPSPRQRSTLNEPQMLFSVPDIGNLLFAPSDRRFFNPIWFPYFARPTHVEKLQIPPSRNPLRRVEQSDIWMFEQPIGFLNITVNIRSVLPESQ
jgi:hypothetical protein